MEERIQQLEQRLASSQRQVRVILALALLTPAFLVASLALKPDPLAAQTDAAKQRTVLKAPFDVVGADGKRLMTVQEKREGGANVWFYREGNNVSAIIDCSPVGGSFGLVTPDGKHGLILDSIRDGGAISIYHAPPGDAASREGARLQVSGNQGTKFSLADKDGTVLFSKP